MPKCFFFKIISYLCIRFSCTRQNWNKFPLRSLAKSLSRLNVFLLFLSQRGKSEWLGKVASEACIAPL